MYHWKLFKILTLVITSFAFTGHQYISESPDEGYEKWTTPLRHFGKPNDFGQTLVSLKNSSNFDDYGSFDNPMSSIQDGAFDVNEENGRFLSIFTVVQFANVGCTVGGQGGICYTSRECSAIGGTVIGSCARGFGKCCYKEITCGGSTSMNCTYLVSPSYPATYNEARTCTMSFTRTSDTCQLRLDFEAFDSIAPNMFGICTDDQFTVTGEKKFKYFCGTVPDNWHFYLDVNGKDNPTVFNFLTSATSYNRKFKIKVSMIACKQKVPCGCGQYFTGDTGTIQSFNYGGFYLAELNYGICFRKEKNRCTTTFVTAGPSFIACTDLYRIPVGQTSATSPSPSQNVQNLYCQANLNPVGFFAPFASVAIIPSPQTSVTNGPIIIWHMTSDNTGRKYHSTANCPTCAGFHQTFQHNTC